MKVFLGFFLASSRDKIRLSVRAAVLLLVVIALSAPALSTSLANPAASPAAHAKAMAEAQAALRRGDAEAAIKAADEALAQAGDPKEGGEATATAHRVAGDAEVLAKRFDAAAKRYALGAHHAAGQHKLWRTLSDRRLGALKKANRPEQEQRIRGLLDKDQLLMKRLRGGAVRKAELAAAERELDEIAAGLRADKDPQRAALAQVAKARVLALSGEADRALAIARDFITDRTRPAFLREHALDVALRVAIARKDLEAEVRHGLELDAVRNARHEPQVRRYSRSAPVDRACARFEAKAGAGRCALLAKELTGEYSFQDPWRAKAKQTVSAADIGGVQEQYVPVLKGCIEDALRGRKDEEMFHDATIKIDWAVTSTGTAREIEISPKRYDRVLGRCVRERVGWFRYPRGRDGRVHNVSIPYTLELIERVGFR